MTKYNLSHFTQGKFYCFYRHNNAPKASATTHTGYSLYINISPSVIKAHQNDLIKFFQAAHIPFYLTINDPTGYPGKNIIAYLGREPNQKDVQILCQKIEKLLIKNRILPECLPEGASEKRRAIPGSLYLSYSNDYHQDRPHISCPRLFSRSDLHPAFENAFVGKSTPAGKRPKLIHTILKKGATSYQGSI